MKKHILFILCAILTPFTGYAADNQQLVDETRGAIMALGAELKATLQSTMKSEGPVKAISVCNVQAPKLAEKVSSEKGMEVSRTALRIRNELNAPDPWELAVLEQFEHRKAEGEAAKNIEYSEITRQNGNRVFRYMKAIPTDDVCLMCHGENISQSLSAELNKLYPDDKATGFKKGDIRGAFSAMKILD